MRRRILLLTAALLLCSSPALPQGQQQSSFSPDSRAPDPAITAQWKKAGGSLMWIQSGTDSMRGRSGTPRPDYLPFFQFDKRPENLADLPVVDVPFELIFFSPGTPKATTQSFTDDDLRGLAKQKNLRQLDLHYTGVTEKSLENLQGLKLRDVLLPKSAYTDRALKQYLDVIESQELRLTPWSIGDDSLKQIAQRTSLRTLAIASSQITDAGLEHLAPLRNLSKLELGGSKITDTGLKHLAPLKHLKQLTLSGAGFTDAGMPQLLEFKELEFVDLYNTKVTRRTRDLLAPLKLRNLRLPGYAFPLEILENAATMQKFAGQQSRAQDMARMKKQFDEIVAADPTYVDAWLARGKFRSEWENKFDDADSDLHKALELAPDNALIYYELLSVARRKKDSATEKKIAQAGYPRLKAALAKLGPKAKPDPALIEVAFAAEQSQDVIDLTSRLLPPGFPPFPQLTNQDKNLLRMRAISYFLLGESSRGNSDAQLIGMHESESEKYRARNPTLKLADVWSKLGFYDDASVVRYRFRPFLADVVERHNLDVAVRRKAVDEYMAANPRSAEAFALRGVFNLQVIENPAGARNDLTKAVELDPQRSDLRLYLARSYRELRDMQAARKVASEGVKLRLAERSKLAKPPEPDDRLIALAFHAEQWDDVLKYCTPWMRDRRNTYALVNPYVRYAILSDFARGRTADAQKLFDAFRQQGSTYAEDFRYDTRYYKSRNKALSQEEAYKILLEQADSTGDTGYRDKYVDAMLNNFILEHPQFGPPYLLRARNRWQERRIAMGFSRGVNESLTLPLNYDVRRETAEKQLALHSLEKIRADLDRAQKRGVPASELDKFREEVNSDGVFHLEWPQRAPKLAAVLASLDRHIEYDEYSVRTSRFDESRDRKELLELREQRAKLILEFGDLIGAIDAYSKLISDTGGEHNLAKKISGPGAATTNSGPAVFSINPPKKAAAAPKIEAVDPFQQRVAGWYMERGKSLHLIGRIDEAYLDFGMAVAYDPARRAEVVAFQNTRGKERVAEPQKKHFEWLIMMASELEARRNYEAAREMLLAAQKINPECEGLAMMVFEYRVFEGYLGEARAAVQNRPEEAVRKIIQAKKLFDMTTSEEVHGDALVQLGKVPAAIAEYDSCIRQGEQSLDNYKANKYKPSAKVFHELARIYFARSSAILEGPKSQAKPASSTPRTRSFRPRNTTPAPSRSRMQIAPPRAVTKEDNALPPVEEVRHLESARVGLVRAIELHPEDPQLYLELGKCLLVMGKSSEAESQFAAAPLLKSPGSAEKIKAAREWAKAYKPADQGAAAINRFLMPAKLKFEEKKYADVIRECTAGLQFNPGKAQFLALRGRAHLQMGKIKEALTDINLAVSREPAAEVYLALAEAQLATKASASAIPSADKALELDPKLTQAQVVRGTASLRLGKLPEAAKDLHHHDGKLYTELLLAVRKDSDARKIPESELRNATDNNDIKTYAQLLQQLLHDENVDQKEKWSLAFTLAAMNNVSGHLYLANAYQSGKGVPCDLAKAKAYFARAKSAGENSVEPKLRLLTLSLDLMPAK